MGLLIKTPNNISGKPTNQPTTTHSHIRLTNMYCRSSSTMSPAPHPGDFLGLPLPAFLLCWRHTMNCERVSGRDHKNNSSSEHTQDSYSSSADTKCPCPRVGGCCWLWIGLAVVVQGGEEDGIYVAVQEAIIYHFC